MMKKTLIVLALAATTVSGSAMAWSSAGAGGSLTLGGTATPPGQVSVWEVLMGKEVTGLDMQIAKDVKLTSMTTTDAIPVIGIRTIANTPFLGGPGLNPNVSFNGIADFSTTVNGVTTATLDIKENNVKIGTITMPLFTGAISSEKSVNTEGKYDSQWAGSNINGFFGGLGTSAASVGSAAAVESNLVILDPELAKNFNNQGGTLQTTPVHSSYSSPGISYSGYYGAGILPGSVLTITLDTNKKVGTTNWSASFPVSVTYQ